MLSQELCLCKYSVDLDSLRFVKLALMHPPLISMIFHLHDLRNLIGHSGETQ